MCGERAIHTVHAIASLICKKCGLCGTCAHEHFKTVAVVHPIPITLQVHDESYVRRFLDGSIDKAIMRRIGLPWSPTLVQRTLIGTGSAVLAARLAAQFGVAVMCNGGTHHAHRDHGTGALVLATVLRCKNRPVPHVLH